MQPFHADGRQVDDAGQGCQHLHVADHLADRSCLVDGGVDLAPQVQRNVEQEEEEVGHAEAGQEEAGVVAGVALPPAHDGQGHSNGRVANHANLKIFRNGLLCCGFIRPR